MSQNSVRETFSAPKVQGQPEPGVRDPRANRTPTLTLKAWVNPKRLNHTFGVSFYCTTTWGRRPRLGLSNASGVVLRQFLPRRRIPQAGGHFSTHQTRQWSGLPQRRIPYTSARSATSGSLSRGKASILLPAPRSRPAGSLWVRQAASSVKSFFANEIK